MSILIEAKSLRKLFGSFTAVDSISFHVEEGECFAFLGPNGSGKTSTLKMISCVSPITSGELKVLGLGVRSSSSARLIRSRLGVIPQEENLDDDFTVIQNLLVYSRYYNVPSGVALQRAKESLQFFHLADREKSKIDTLSGGMKKRVLIARALIHQPKMLILDEPTTGLDPQARIAVWDSLLALKEHGITLLLSTNYMDEAAYMADRLIILEKGKIVAEGQPRELISRHVGEQVVEVSFRSNKRETILAQVSALGVPFREGAGRIYIFSKDGKGLPKELPDGAESVVMRSANLEDVFLQLSGRTLREE